MVTFITRITFVTLIAFFSVLPFCYDARIHIADKPMLILADGRRDAVLAVLSVLTRGAHERSEPFVSRSLISGFDRELIGIVSFEECHQILHRAGIACFFGKGIDRAEIQRISAIARLCRLDGRAPTGDRQQANRRQYDDAANDPYLSSHLRSSHKKVRPVRRT